MKPPKHLLPAGRHPRRLRWGLYRGLNLALDLHCELQCYLGLYECETFPTLRRLARGCRSIADVGAAKGELSIHFLRTPGMEAVLAVEPSSTELALFATNLALNGFTGDPRLRLHAGFAGRGRPPLWRTLDDLLTVLPAPHLLKIDVEGSEGELLDTGIESLSARDCRLLIETHSPEAEAGCAARLHTLHYEVQILPPAWWRRYLPEHRPIPHNRWLAAWKPTAH